VCVCVCVSARVTIPLSKLTLLLLLLLVHHSQTFALPIKGFFCHSLLVALYYMYYVCV
jgi:hypothetical protein